MLVRVDAADGSGNSQGDRAGAVAGPREYRIAELARQAGITVRTLRYYRERKLFRRRGVRDGSAGTHKLTWTVCG